MIHSMTGFGKAITEWEGKKITCEVKSLNSKQADISVRLSSTYKSKELYLRSALIKALKRGKIELSIYIENTSEETNFNINKNLALAYLKDIKDLNSAIKGDEQRDYLDLILKMPEVVKSAKQEINEDEWKAIEKCFGEALNQLINFRESEGGKLSSELQNRINNISKLLEEVKKGDDNRVEEIKKRINDNLEKYINPKDIDKNRFEQELIYYLEKLDITEEKVRLKTHCDYFLETINAAEGQGKKLGFISQEIGREINTIGSKANSAAIQKLVVQMKDELEKIKEQSLNIL